MRIAIALEDDGVTLAHFGHAERFLVYDDEDGIFRLAEARRNNPPCGREDSEALMTASAGLVSDCAAVVAGRFGPCALREIQQVRVFPFEWEGSLDRRLLTGLARMRNLLLGKNVGKERGRIS